MNDNRTNPGLPSFPYVVIGLSIVASAAAYFRFSRLGELMVFATDQGRAMLAGRNILLGQWQLFGPQTSLPGFHLGPFYYYLTAAALWLARFDPLGPAMMVAFTGVAAACLLFLFARRYWNPYVALTAGLLLALSPLAAAQSRIAIEPGPLPFFVLLWLWSAQRWLETGRKTWLAGAIGITLLAIQLNFSAVSLFPILAATWLLTNRQLVPDRKRLAVLLGGLPILLAVFWRSLAGTLTQPAYLGQGWRELTAPFSVWVAAGLLGLALAGIALLFKRPRTVSTVLIACWLVLGGLAFLIKRVSGAHSLAILFPLAPLLIGIGFESLRRRLPLLTLVLLISLGLFLSGQTQRYVFEANQLVQGDHQRVVNKIIELAAGEPYYFVYRGHLDVYDAADDHYQYLLWLSGQPPADSARIELVPMYRERWLLQRGKANRTIMLYFPDYEADRYPAVGPRIRYDLATFEIVEGPADRI